MLWALQLLYLDREIPKMKPLVHPINFWLSFLKRPVVHHSLFWLVYFFLNVIRWGSYTHEYLYAIKANLVEFPLHIILAYFNLYYLIPKLLPTKYIIYVLSVLLSIVVIVSLRMLLIQTLDIWPEANLIHTFSYQDIWELGIGEIYVLGFITMVKLLLDWGRSHKRTRELEKRNFQTELNFLKSQIQPHFFFNTLNNLYALTLEKSDRAPDTVLKLSELMSYVIYEGKQQKVPLSKEINYIENFLDLERLRFGERLKVNFKKEGTTNGMSIAPLILISFIENSFKHGVHPSSQTINIDILLKVVDSSLLFIVENDKPPIPVNGTNNLEGIGIKNSRRRLDLIYSKDYKLDILENENKYKVALKIPAYEN